MQTKSVQVTEEFEEPKKRWWLSSLVPLSIGACLYFTVFWFVIWPVVVDSCKDFYPQHPGWITFLWLMALLIWSLPLCCIVFYLAARGTRIIHRKMEQKRRQLFKPPFQPVPYETNLCLVQPEHLRIRSSRGVSCPSVIIEEEVETSLPPSPVGTGSPASLRHDASTKALYTGSSKRVSLMDEQRQRKSSSNSIDLQDKDIEEALKNVSVSSSEDDVFKRGTIFVTPRSSFVLAIQEGSDDEGEKNMIRNLSTSNAIFEQEQQTDSEDLKTEITDKVPKIAEIQHEMREKPKFVKQTSQSEFFVSGGYRKQSVTSEAIIEIAHGKIEQYTPGKFVVLQTTDDECLLLPSQVKIPQINSSSSTAVVMAPALFYHPLPIQLEFGTEPENLQTPAESNPVEGALQTQQVIDCIRHIYLGKSPLIVRVCCRCGGMSQAQTHNSLRLSAAIKAWDQRWIKSCRCGGAWRLHKFSLY